MEELDHLLSTDQQGLRVLTDGQALNNNIEEWLDTPEHTVADNPAWGHNLTPFLFEAPSDDLAVAMEISIAEKLPADVEGAQVSGVRVSWSGIDCCLVTVQHQYGLFSQQLPQAIDR